jgi:hypothetical protein
VNIGINMAKRKHNVYLLSWDMTGLETILDLTMLEKLHAEEEKLRLVQILGDPDLKDPGNATLASVNRAVGSIMMRARANSQRHYEIYTIQTDPSVSEGDMWELFNSDPQHAAELIRERGNKLYSDRAEKRTQVIV